jgi:hypothetical protein
MGKITDLDSQGSMITPGLPQLGKQYHKSKDEVSSIMVGGHSFAAGAMLFFVAAGASIIGKRLFYVIGSVLLLVTGIWGYFASVSVLFRRSGTVY